MTYTIDIVIEVPLDICVQKFANLENSKHWQRGLMSIEHISGVPGEFGAKMKLHYQIGKRRMALVETLTHKNPPYELHSIYTTEGADDFQENYFQKTPENHTKWTSINEFIPLNFKMRLMLWMMPKTFKKQSLQYMKDFKNFVENGTSVAYA